MSPIQCISTEILHFCRLLISVIYQSVCNVLGSWSGLPSDPIRTSTILAVWQAYIDGNINETAYCIRSVNHFQEDNTRYHLIHFCLHPDLFSFAWVDADLPRRALKGQEEAQTLLFVHFSKSIGGELFWMVIHHHHCVIVRDVRCEMWKRSSNLKNT